MKCELCNFLEPFMKRLQGSVTIDTAKSISPKQHITQTLLHQKQKHWIWWLIWLNIEQDVTSLYIFAITSDPYFRFSVQSSLVQHASYHLDVWEKPRVVFNPRCFAEAFAAGSGAGDACRPKDMRPNEWKRGVEVIMKRVEFLKLLKWKWLKTNFSSPVLLNYEQQKNHRQYGGMSAQLCVLKCEMSQGYSFLLSFTLLGWLVGVAWPFVTQTNGWSMVEECDPCCLPGPALCACLWHSGTANPHQQKNWPASGLAFGIPPMNEPFNPLIGSHGSHISHHESSCSSQNGVTAFTRHEWTKQ